MKRIFILLLLISACKSNIEEEITKSSLRLTKTQHYDVNNKLIGTTFFEYDEKQRLIHIRDTTDLYISKLVYENDRLISMDNWDKITNFTYQNDLIISSSIFYKETGQKINYEYEYNSKKELIKSQGHSIYGNMNIVCESNYTYNILGNIDTKTESCTNSGLSKLEYDIMNNPKSLLYSPEVMKVLEHGKNNITNVYKNNSLQFYYQYEYNEYDYPSSRTISYGYKDVYTYENIYSE